MVIIKVRKNTHCILYEKAYNFFEMPSFIKFIKDRDYNIQICSPCTEGLPMFHQGLSGRPAD